MKTDKLQLKIARPDVKTGKLQVTGLSYVHGDSDAFPFRAYLEEVARLNATGHKVIGHEFATFREGVRTASLVIVKFVEYAEFVYQGEENENDQEKQPARFAGQHEAD